MFNNTKKSSGKYETLNLIHASFEICCKTYKYHMVLNINNLSYCKDVFLSVYHGFGIIFFGWEAGNTELWTLFVEKRSG